MSKNPITTSKTAWIPALAGYRAIAALAVFVFHIISIDPPAGPIDTFTRPLGNAAVTVFFVLSGFLIYRPFARWAFGEGPPIQTMRFIVRRAFRILPLYWVVLTVHLLLRAESGYSLGEMLTAYGLIQNFRGFLVFVPPFVAWSLCIELWFSVLLPFIAAPLRRLGRNRSRHQNLIIQLAGIEILVFLAIGFRIWALTGNPESGRLIWMPGYLDWFAAGLLLAVWATYRSGQELGSIARVPKPLILGVVGFGCYVATTQIGLPSGFNAPTATQVHLQFGLQLVMGFCLVAAAVLPGLGTGLVNRFLSSSMMAWLGAVSYGIYLIHPVVVDEMIEVWPELSLWAISPVALALTLGLAGLTHSFVEKPASLFGDRFAKLQAPDLVRLWPGALRSNYTHLCLGLTAFAIPLLTRPGTYVADARYEVFVDPGSRLQRMFTLWDSSRDLGRVAEEFWPAITVFAATLGGLGIQPWMTQRLWHGLLLAMACLGASVLAKALVPDRPLSAALGGLLYAFGPFSAIYLVPSTLYWSYAIAPWLVLAVVRVADGDRVLKWSAIVALSLFGAGNADPPGLVFAMVPAAITWVWLMVRDSTARPPLRWFAVCSGLLTAFASTAMLVKTGAGAGALSHRLLETEGVDVTAATSSFSESIRGMGFWVPYFELGPVSIRSQQQLFIENGWVVLATVAPVVFSIWMLGRLRVRAASLALVWLLVGTIAMVGPYPTDSPSPYGRLLLWLFDNSEFAFGFRSSHKAGVISALGLSMLAGWAMGTMVTGLLSSPKFPKGRGVSLIAVGAVVLSITQPFWRGQIYDPAFTSVQAPAHWQDLGVWFEENPPSGRVLVLPGSTNNGYLWGSVGDDLLDPLVPNRVVASTLPLSTPLAADLIAALDRAVADGSYQPGSFEPLARRLGISTVIIRNDLNTELQGLPSPKALDRLRADSDLQLAASFGVAGLYDQSLTYPQLQVYEVGSEISDLPTVVPASANRRQILVDGNADALIDLAALGALDGGNPVRFAPTLSIEDLDQVASDVALVVLSDSNRSTDRRINFYGYDFSESESNSIAWLPDFAAGSTSITEIPKARVTTTVDRWSLGPQHAPMKALDGDPTTSWIIPILFDELSESWRIDFDEPRLFESVVLSLQDDGNRVSGLLVEVNGKAVPVSVVDQMAFVPTTESVRSFKVSFRNVAEGPTSIGLREVSFNIPTDVPASELEQPVRPVVKLPRRIAAMTAASPEAMRALESAEIWVMVGHDDYSPAPIKREFELWDNRTWTLSAQILTNATEPICTSEVLSVNGIGLPVLITPVGSGLGQVSLCEDSTRISLSQGSHLLEISPGGGELWRQVVLQTSTEPIGAVGRRTLGTDDDTQLERGDLLITPSGFDSRWVLGSDAVGPFALDALTSWQLNDRAQFAEPSFGLDGRMRLALWVTGLALAVALFSILFPVRLERLWAKLSWPALLRRPGAATVGSYQPDSLELAVLLVLVAGIFAGVAGLAGIGVGYLIHRRLGRQAMYSGAALMILIATVIAVWPLIFGDGSQIDPADGDIIVRVAIGALFAGLGFDLALGHGDEAVPRSELT